MSKEVHVKTPVKGVWGTHIPTGHTVTLEMSIEGGQGFWVVKDHDAGANDWIYRIVNVDELRGFYIRKEGAGSDQAD
jgi:hypothetical protein